MPRARRIIFACGVRFIRFKSARVSGRASGSASAARSTAAGVMGRNPLRVFLEIAFLLMSGGTPGRYNSDNFFPFGIHHGENAALNHAYDHKTFLTIAMFVVKNFYGERVLEH